MRVRPGDVASIAAGLVELVRDNARLRAAIAENAAALFARFDPEATVAGYRADLTEIGNQRRFRRLSR